MTKHGGIRDGAGRPAGSQNRATIDMKSRLSMLAREFTWEAFDTLLDVCKNGQSDSARIAATTALLDRGLLTSQAMSERANPPMTSHPSRWKPSNGSTPSSTSNVM
jgi:hypothetical protein